MKKLVFTLLSLVFLFISCQREVLNPDSMEIIPQPADIGNPNTEGITIAILDSYQFSVHVEPADLAKEVIWSVANDRVATIDKNGLVTGIGKGTTFVRATIGTYTVGFVINVTPFNSLTLEKHNFVAWIGAAGEQKLHYTTIPESAMSEPVSWTSSNENIAKVSNTGVITAIAPGDVTIIANGAGKLDSCTVTVMGVTVSPSHAWLNINDELSITVSNFTANVPSSASAIISYNSDNTSIANVSSSGIISASSSGYTNVKITIAVPALDPIVYEREVIVFNPKSTVNASGINFDMIKINGNGSIADFFIGTTEVTQGLWNAIMSGYPHAQDKGSGDNFPVYYVSWYDAVQFCNTLSTLIGKTPYYNIVTNVIDPNNNATTANDPFKWTVTIVENADGFRLPTEMEWLYAAKGGVYTHNYNYSGSNVLADVAWFSGNASGNIHEVGTKNVNEIGLYDMNGNVKEWCFDWFSAEGVGFATSGANRVARGGAYNEASQQIFLTDRAANSALNQLIYGAPGKNDVKFGLRIVCSVQ